LRQELPVTFLPFAALLASILTQASVQQTAAVQAAIARVGPSLVRIHVVTLDHVAGREVKREAAGSGTIISPDGYVLTNHHVAGRTRAITCTLATREEIPADLVGTDPLSDLAVLKLRPRSPRTFPVASFGDVSKLKVGDPVLALGSPLALSQSVTMGIVSNVEMIMPGLFWPFNRMTLDGEDVGSIVRWIGHDAPIYGGNSGGPLVNLQGEIVGVNEISLGLAGAIPADLAKEVSAALIKDGHVRRSWIGLEIQPRLESSPVKKGALVGSTIDGSPAAQAGFQPGDILLRLGGRDVNVQFAEEVPIFNQYIMRLPLGQRIDATVLRDGSEKTLHVTPVERASVEAPVKELPLLGLTASNLSFWSAKELKRKDLDGVRVRDVRPGGASAEAKPPLEDDDVIVEMDGAPVHGVEALAAALEKAVKGSPEAVPTMIGFDRSGERLLTVISLNGSALDDPGREATKAWLPINTQVLTPELAEMLKAKGRSGFRVTQLLNGSAGLGLQVGDIILAVNDDRLQASQPSDGELLATTIRQYKIGTEVQLTVLRGEREQTLQVKLRPSPRLPREMKKYDDDTFEFRVRDVSPIDRERGGWPEGEGVLVESVTEGGWAALGHLAEGDLILTINGAKVASVAEVQQRMAQIAASRPPSVVLSVRRGIRTFFVEMQSAWTR
jgi:serine protease Do